MFPMMFFHLTLKSRNRKTGPIPVSTTSRGSCPDCPLHGNGCYADGQPLLGFWEKVSDGRSGVDFDTFLASVSALPINQLWRHNQAGDLPGEHNRIDPVALGKLVAANRGKRGFTYTHKPVLGADPIARENRVAIAAANENGFTVNLSANSVAEVDALADLAIAPVVTVLPEEYGRKSKNDEWLETLAEYRARAQALNWKTPAGRTIAPCPATFLDTSCRDCGLCQKITNRAPVGFPAHGAAKGKANAVALAAAA
jgi:hypothetical protein